MDTAAIIPESAWIQAVFVCLFVVFAIGLLGWFGKQQDKWQKFISSLNDDWQKFLERERADNCVAMNQVTEALDRLSTKLDAHDEKVEKRIHDAIGQVQPKRRV